MSLDTKAGRCRVWDVGGEGIPEPSVACDLPASLLAVARRPGGAAFGLVVHDKTDRESVRLFDQEGKALNPVDLPGAAERITALSLSDDGNRVVLGTRSGRVVNLNIQGQQTPPDRPPLPGGEVKHLMIQPLWLLAGSGNTVHVLLGEGRKGAELDVGEPIQQVTASADGRRVAACGTHGVVHAWEIAADGATATPIALTRQDAGAGLSLAFAPGGDVLAAGDSDGRLRSWKVPAGDELPTVAADKTGRIGHVAVAPDGRTVLQIAYDGIRPTSGQALVWRFGDDTEARPVPGGSFQPVGGFLPNDGGVVLLDERGNLAVHRPDAPGQPLLFEAPMIGGRIPAVRDTDAAALSISADGSRVAVGSGEYAVVWSTADRRLAVKPFSAHRDKIRAVALSRDGRRLITAADDRRVKLWDLSGAGAPLEQEVSAIAPDAKEVPRPVTAAAFSPKDARIFALGRADGKIELWNPALGQQPRPVESLEEHVKTLVFSPDGAVLAAAGNDRRITMVRTDRRGDRVVLTVRKDSPAASHHSERINALAFWPNGKQLASASHDATIRLWRLEDEQHGSLLGTLAGSNDGREWVVFTPEGLFDGSAAGERRVTWRLDPKWWSGQGDGLVARLDQLGRRFRVLDLADTLRRGARPELQKWDEVAPPQVALETVAPPSTKQREVAVRARLSQKGAG